MRWTRGDAVEGERRVREALQLAEPSGGWLVAELNADLAELLVDLGRLDEAEAAGHAAAEVPESDPTSRSVASVAAARVAAASGDRGTVRRHAAEALEIYLSELESRRI